MKELIKDTLVDLGLSFSFIFNYLIMSTPAGGSFGSIIKYLISQAFLAILY